DVLVVVHGERGFRAGAPARDGEARFELPVRVEDLHAAVHRVGDVDLPGRSDRDADRRVELGRAGSLLAESLGRREVLVADDDALVAGVGDPDAAVRRDRDAARPVEVAGRLAERRSGEREVQDAAVPSVGDVEIVATDRERARVLELVWAVSLSAPPS